MVRAQSELDQVSWAREDWEPPRIELASFRIEGKIARDLDPVEAGIFIGVPYKQILSTILSQLVQRNCMNVITRDPLVVEIVSPPPVAYSSLGRYESMMYKAAKGDGKFSEPELSGLLKEIVYNVKQKAWDCDVEATTNFYEDRIADAFTKVKTDSPEAEKRDRLRDDPADSWWYWYHYNRGIHNRYDPYHYDHEYEASLNVDPETATFQEFLGSSIEGINACHAACLTKPLN